jgi:hypothetical protein
VVSGPIIDPFFGFPCRHALSRPSREGCIENSALMAVCPWPLNAVFGLPLLQLPKPSLCWVCGSGFSPTLPRVYGYGLGSAIRVCAVFIFPIL